MANATPLAPTLTGPPNDSYIIVSEPNVFEWVFNDPGDIQSYYLLRFKKAGDPGWTTTAAILSPVSSHTLPASTWAQPFVFEWQVQTLDNIGQPSPWSASRFVNTIPVIPAPTITAPAPAAVVTTTPLLVEWTLPGGFTQDAYFVQVVRNEAPYDFLYASGVIESVTQFDLAEVPTLPGIPMFVYVSFTYNGHFGFATRPFTNAILPPETPLLVCEQVEDKPEVTISITNPPASDAGHLDTVSVDVLRNGVRIKAGLAPNSSFTDRKVGAGTVDYRAVAKTALGGTATSF